MKKALALAAAAALTVGPFAGTAAAHQVENGPPKHGHVLVLGLEWDASGNPVSARKCVDLANGQALPLTAHHHSIHTGAASEALMRAGHLGVPTAPVTPWRNCAELLAFFGL